MSAVAKRKCALPGCQQEFSPPAAAPHKKFCCVKHKDQFHSGEILRARRLLAMQQQTSGSSQSETDGIPSDSAKE